MTKMRSGYWDNAKLLLIFTVVLAHYFGTGIVYTTRSGDAWAVPNAVYAFIYMFHMPVFTFISGYFSKNTVKSRNTSFRNLLLPYVFFNTLFIGIGHVLLGETVYNPVFYPHGHMWYLIALFIWRYFAGDISKIRFHWFWLLLFSLFCSAFLPGKNWVLMSRVITFWPFFQLGVITTPEQIQKLRRLPKWLCAGVLLTVFGGTLFALSVLGMETFQLCFFSNTFGHSVDSLPYVGIMLGRYVLAFLMGVCIFNLIPEKTISLTAVGGYTMTILLFHSVPGLREWIHQLNPMPENAWLFMLWYTLWTVAAVILFGNRYTDRAYRYVMAWIADKIPKASREKPT